VVFEILALCKRLNERRRAFVVDVLKQNTWKCEKRRIHNTTYH
jgi:hypothetical protein